MIKIKNLFKAVDEAAPFDTQMGFDNSGLLVGDCDSEVDKVLICLDITKRTVDEAVRIGAGCILSHHPVIFDPLKRIEKGTPVAELVKHDIAALCAHTNLDASMEIGVNKALCEKLGLSDFHRDEESEMLFGGKLPHPMKSSEFASYAAEKLEAPYLTYTGEEHEITTVGFCSGGGGEFLMDSIGKYDAYLTGEVKHHQLIYAEDINYPMFVGGHYATEKVFAQPLKEYLENILPDCEFILSADEHDPAKIQ